MLLNGSITGFIVTAAAVLLCASTASAGVDQWTICGPDWVNSLIVEVNPIDTDIVYGIGANTCTGLFLSGDGTSTWELSNQGLGMNAGNAKRMSAYGFDEADPDVQFCAITDDGLGNQDYVFRSADGGSSWTRILQSQGPLNVNLSCIDAYSGTVYIGAGNVLYRSDDYGSSFSQVYTFSSSIRSLSLDPNDPATVYVSASGIYRSTDGGGSFSTAGFSGKTVIYVGVHPEGAETYITASVYNDGFYISSDNGQSWNERDSGLPTVGPYLKIPYDVAYSPGNSSVIYAAVPFGGIYKTTDGGFTWTNSQGDIENPYPGGSLDDMLGVSVSCCNEGGNDTVYLASNWGIHKSTNGGTNWEIAGVPGQNITSVDFAGCGPYNGYAGGGIGVFSYQSQNWAETTYLAEIGCGTSVVTIDPDNDQTVLVGGSSSFNDVVIRKITNGGADFETVYDGSGQESGSISSIEYDPDDHSRVLATFCIATGMYTDGGLLVSTNGGDSFVQDSYFEDTPLTNFAISPSNPDYMYACSYYGQVWASTDGGESWVFKSNSDIIKPVITVDPENPQHLYMGCQSETEALLVSEDGGTSWESGGFGPGLIKSIEITDNEIFLAAYGDGVYYGSGNGTWNDLNDGLDNTRVNDLWVEDNGSVVTLYAATNGAGVCEIELDQVEIGEQSSDLSSSMGFTLSNPYPNPSNGSVTIQFSLQETSIVHLDIYDISGRIVESLANETLSSGEHELMVSGLASGVYLCRMGVDNQTMSRKMIVNR